MALDEQIENMDFVDGDLLSQFSQEFKQSEEYDPNFEVIELAYLFKDMKRNFFKNLLKPNE